MADQVPVTGPETAAVAAPEASVDGVDRVAMVSRDINGNSLQAYPTERVLSDEDAATADLAQGVVPGTETPLEADEALRVRDEVRGGGGASISTVNPPRDVADATTDEEKAALTPQVEVADSDTAAGVAEGSNIAGPPVADKDK